MQNWAQSTTVVLRTTDHDDVDAVYATMGHFLFSFVCYTIIINKFTQNNPKICLFFNKYIDIKREWF